VADGETKKLAGWIGRRLARGYPDARCSLDFTNPLELYVATVLSAQCTDVRVNQVTPELFRLCPRPEDYLALGPEGLEKRIQSTGFFRNKAKSILGGCARLIEEFGGEMPRTMEELLTLPGVGRKTANVILGNAFGKQEGVVVDTHVGRVAVRLGLTEETDPVKAERDLMTLFPRKDWTVLSHRLILHGRNVCVARGPRCAACTLAERCRFAAAPAPATKGRRRPARGGRP
jgi:endonuclease-3